MLEGKTLAENLFKCSGVNITHTGMNLPTREEVGNPVDEEVKTNGKPASGHKTTAETTDKR